jgi:hypothetical protein
LTGAYGVRAVSSIKAGAFSVELSQAAINFRRDRPDALLEALFAQYSPPRSLALAAKAEASA